ncbi:bifunctional (p)ppGpp synthetase/guanosine-3',5'-bis(diphosphate) 3'-pyrophosphohydrolase [bacterium]|nr:MAG: bifunctional (p)ppGpp synthetase/guanosine-3',5'-bis(diphosphate) 3'-pyrophosphohydrolase [bacterium]
MDLTLLRRAFEFALTAHGGQLRKGAPVPIISHLMAVSGLVLEFGGTAEEGAAALLHDCVEDTSATLDDLRKEFGEEVARIVMECTDSLAPCPPVWQDRKERFIRCIPTLSASARLVIAADKLHNARDVVRSQRERGDDAFRIFHGRKEGTVWYYRAALESLEAAEDPSWGLRALLDDLRREVEEMRRLADLIHAPMAP